MIIDEADKNTKNKFDAWFRETDKFVANGLDNCKLLDELIESPKKADNYSIKIPLKNAEIFVSVSLFLTTYIKGGVWQYLLPHMIIEKNKIRTK
tara:strand:+ start:467 stop:748 length:282 start_codon:yes stop_codon:yes gene_type:complete